MRRWIVFAASGLVILAAGVAGVGMLLPKTHRASRTVMHDATPATVFAMITDFARFPEWRSGIRAVETIDTGDGKTRFTEQGPNGTITYAVDMREPFSRLVTRIDDPSLPFGGTWTFDLRPVAGGTELTITEDGEVYNPIFRVLSRVVFSPSSTIDTYQTDLRERLRRPAGDDRVR